MNVTARHGIRMPERGQIARARRGPGSRLPRPQIHFGVALWPYDLLLRFAWDLPENEARVANDWFDDVFESAAVRLRHTAPKLIHAIMAMQPPLETLKYAALEGELTREQVEAHAAADRSDFASTWAGFWTMWLPSCRTATATTVGC